MQIRSSRKPQDSAKVKVSFIMLHNVLCARCLISFYIVVDIRRIFL
jgi:hypothetical protein